MNRSDVMDKLYRRVCNKKILEFDQIRPPAMLHNLFKFYDIRELNRIATSNRLSARPKEKYRLINQIMGARGFKKIASGTNRVAYKYLEDQSFIVKTALDHVGISDTPNEYRNQFLLKPYCTKVFDNSPCGTIGMFERVHAVHSKEEFLSIAPDVYTIIVNHIIGRYVLDDFGSKYYQNWGVRLDAHPVLLDFPYVFELDGAKLFCNKKDPYSISGVCGGEIDYDDGFNKLICTKCGKHYNANEFKKVINQDNGILITDRKGEIAMNIKIKKGDTVVQSVNTEKSSDVYKRNRVINKKQFQDRQTPYEYRSEKRVPKISVTVKQAAVNEDGSIVEDSIVDVSYELQTPIGDIDTHIDTTENAEYSKFNSATSVKDQPILPELSSLNDFDKHDEYKDAYLEDTFNTISDVKDALSGNCDGYTVSDTVATKCNKLFDAIDIICDDELCQDDTEIIEDMHNKNIMGEF